ncbi:MAG: hypothetical protein H7Z19_19855 [Chitinophagaceae bacterium]|nr:hypothetical protein [Rubrivivax sp.]
MSRAATAGDVLALNDADGDGRYDRQRTFAEGLPGVHGLAVRGDTLWLASSSHVWRTPAGERAQPETLTDRMPDGGQHPNRTVRIAPDGAVVVSIGSSCNDCAEQNQLLRAVMARIVSTAGPSAKASARSMP